MALFNDVWKQIQHRVSGGLQIPNWSKESGYTGKFTTIDRVYFQEILVVGERGRKPRSVPREEFKRAFDYWEPYKEGHIDRTAVEKEAKTQNTTYIFSLLHWLEHSPDGE